jgi:hypothetical protein
VTKTTIKAGGITVTIEGDRSRVDHQYSAVADDAARSLSIHTKTPLVELEIEMGRGWSPTAKADAQRAAFNAEEELRAVREHHADRAEAEAEDAVREAGK